MTVREESGLYARKLTGLVRAAGKWSVLVYNIMFVSIGLMTLFAISTIPAFYPGANLQLTFVLALIIVLPTSMVFAMLSVAMPRSGGDYVYVSRALGPAWGMMSNWNQTVWWVLYGGVPSAFFAYYGLTPLLRSLGVLTNNPGLITWGDRLSTPTGAFLTGTALIVILVVIFATGMNFYFRIQNVLFVVAMLGVLLTIVLLLTKNPASFRSGFNHSLASTAGTPDPYHAVLAAAKKERLHDRPVQPVLDHHPDHLDLPRAGVQPVLGVYRRRGAQAGPGADLVDAGRGDHIDGRGHAAGLGVPAHGRHHFPRRALLQQRGGAPFQHRADLQRAGVLCDGERRRGLPAVLRVHLLGLLLAARPDPQRVQEPARLRDRRGHAVLALERQRAAAHPGERAGRDGPGLDRGAVALHPPRFPVQDADRDLRLHPVVLHHLRRRDRASLPAAQDLEELLGRTGGWARCR